MGKTAFLFAGQGAQAVGMGKDLYEGNAAAKVVFDMGEKNRPGTLAMCFEGPGEALTRTENTQPCLFLADLACARALEAAGVKADAAAGFSLGEIPALAFAGVMSDEDAFKIVSLRGETMAQCSDANPGSMVAVLKMENAAVEEICARFKNVYPVNYNCPGQLSCAGALDELDDFIEAVKAAGGRAVKLAVSGAFHTPFMAKATEKLSEALSNMTLNVPAITLYSNMTGMPYPTGNDMADKTSMADTASAIDTTGATDTLSAAEAASTTDTTGATDTLSAAEAASTPDTTGTTDTSRIADIIARQASNSVRWEDTIRRMYESGVDTFIEVGAGTTLSGLVKRTLTDVNIYNVSDMATLEATVAAWRHE